MVVNFLNKLELTNDPESDENWILDAPLFVNIDGMKITIPIDFETDLASTPRFLWSIFPPFGRWDEAAVLHDYLYSYHLLNSRAATDAAFYYAMLTCNVPKWRAYLMWLGVRAFGWRYYYV